MCDGVYPAAKTHAAGLVTDGGPVSIVSGDVLLSGLKDGCKWKNPSSN